MAITSKLLHPEIKVICRADSHEVEANMASFGTDYIIDPFDTFSMHLATAIETPCLYLLQRWLGGDQESELDEPVYPPRQGRWVVCGYGRFGKAIASRLKSEGIEVTVVEAEPTVTGEPPPGYVLGVGTEADTLMEAGLDTAVGIVAGTDDDADNLSIVMTARDLNPDVFVVLRQNHSENQSIINAVDADMVMHPSAIIAERIRVLLGTPMLYHFFSLAFHQEDAWACELVSRVSALVRRKVPDVEEIRVDDGNGAAVCHFGESGDPVTIAEVLRNPWMPERELACIILLIQRAGKLMLLPGPETELQKNDRLLVCGDRRVFTRLHWNLCHAPALDAARGRAPMPQGWLWRKIVAWRESRGG